MILTLGSSANVTRGELPPTFALLGDMTELAENSVSAGVRCEACSSSASTESVSGWGEGGESDIRASTLLRAESEDRMGRARSSVSGMDVTPFTLYTVCLGSNTARK